MSKSNGFLYEQGDRWQLDTLIPNKDRRLIGPQIPRTSKQYIATKPVLVTDKHIDPSLRSYTPLHTGPITICEQQAKLRKLYCNEQPLPGDRLL